MDTGPIEPFGILLDFDHLKKTWGVDGARLIGVRVTDHRQEPLAKFGDVLVVDKARTQPAHMERHLVRWQGTIRPAICLTPRPGIVRLMFDPDGRMPACTLIEAERDQLESIGYIGAIIRRVIF